MPHLLLLHGAIGAKDQLSALADQLKADATIHTLNFSGHGGAAMRGEFSIAAFAEDVIGYLDKNDIRTINVFGYSMGGYVALYLAKIHPGRISSVFTFATKFEWTPEIAQKEIRMLDPLKIAEKVPAFAEQLAQRHAPNDWKAVMQQTASMMLSLGEYNPLQAEDYENIPHQVMVAIGDCDQMVTLEETIAVYRKLPNAHLLVLPHTSHPIEKVDIGRLSNEIYNFINS